jgi:hypothetical protein
LETFARTEHIEMSFTEFEAKRQFIDIPAGRIAYVESGSGPVALFLHDRLLNGYFWRHQIQDLSDIRRCKRWISWLMALQPATRTTMFLMMGRQQ